ncbi:SufD family Fe-S cluster assembly protein [Actinomyces ruminicola]|uniref:SufD family Fe-S cluster assembly protein n=1 Tax=Actinomyces ruminicola TaxID=332524 RepID=UPI0011CBE708|nr:SufD family Fe-S cluster assembly protein [Actinomyces ruminicola]
MPELKTDHSRASLEGAHAHGGQRYVSSRAERPTSFDPADIPVPRGREEEWRFTPMKRFAPLFDLEAVLAGTAVGPLAVDVDAPEGADVETVARQDPRLGSVGAPVDRTGVVAWAAFDSSTVLTLRAGAGLGRAARVTTTGNDPDLAHPAAQHLLINALNDAVGTVVLDHRGTAALTQTVEVIVADGAELTLVTIQGWEDGAVHASNHRVRVEGRGTDTYELNRNLVLTEGAKADSIPNLEIENGNIEGAGHASATGRFDDEQLFYLRARGIPEMEARRLVVLGFFNEIVAEIRVPEVEERLMAAIEKELELTGLVSAREPAPPAL